MKLSTTIIAIGLILSNGTAHAEANIADQVPGYFADALRNIFENTKNNFSKPIAIGPEHWVSVPAKEKDVCMRETKGVINEEFMTCRRGFDALVRNDLAGNPVILKVKLK